jgi:hypothetical protein
MTRDAIATDKLAAPVGPFSLGVRAQGCCSSADRWPQAPATGRLIDGDVARQTHQILSNISTAMETVGRSSADVLPIHGPVAGCGYRLGSDRGSPNHGSTLASNRVMPQMREPASVST